MRTPQPIGCLAGAAAVGSLLAVAAAAAVPEQVSHQGVLLVGGTVVPDGAYDLIFEVFDTPAAGTRLHGETLQVSVEQGLYNVVLSGPGLADALADSPRYLQVTLAAGPPLGSAYPIALEPRQHVTSAPFALSAQRAVTTAAESWQSAAPVNGWGVFGGPWAHPAFYKDAGGVVHLRGLLAAGDTDPGTEILTLPEGYRPDGRLMFSVWTCCAGGEVPGAVHVTAGGAVVVRVAHPTWLSLGGIRFRAAAP